LRAIEAQHGLLIERATKVWSFSHLTFQEYLVARQIAEEPINEIAKYIMSSLEKKPWKTVLLLTLSILSRADELLQLMKLKIDELVADDEIVQQFLFWVYEKSSIPTHNKPASYRAFFIEFSPALARCLDQPYSSSELAKYLRWCFDDLYLGTALFELYDRNSLALYIDSKAEEHFNALDKRDVHTYYHDLRLVLEPLLRYGRGNSHYYQQLNKLKKQLPANLKDDKKWWKENGKNWTDQLRNIMIDYFDIGHHWQFSKEQLEKFDLYYDLNRKLVICLNADCCISTKLLKEIEDTLLLPFAEIEKRKHEKVE
jgi:predicted NACHT family NTPase